MDEKRADGIGSESNSAADEHRPVVEEVGVIGLVPDRWGERWQPRHQVLSRLGRYFPTVWINPAPGWRAAWTHPSAYRVADSHPRPGLEIHSPDLLFPRFYRPVRVAGMIMRQRLKGARERLTRRGCKKIVLYVWRPELADALSILPHDLSCYHIDDEYTFDAEDRPISRQEEALLRRVDQVIIHSPGLLEKKGHLNPNTSFVPNGVDYAAHADPVSEPEDLRSIVRPIIGYTGWLKSQLDWDLLETLAARHRDWSFVLVGSAHPEIAARVAEAGEHANIHLLGGRSSAELAFYPQHFDVCVMPYNDDPYTRYIYPLKLHEYLASGTPTVGTPIRSLEAFSSVVELARGPDEWCDAIERALRDRSEEHRAARQTVAREHDWESLVHRIAQQMADALGPEIARRIRDASPFVSEADGEAEAERAD